MEFAQEFDDVGRLLACDDERREEEDQKHDDAGHCNDPEKDTSEQFGSSFRKGFA